MRKPFLRPVAWANASSLSLAFTDILAVTVAVSLNAFSSQTVH
jgi:hypothetical protein